MKSQGEAVSPLIEGQGTMALQDQQPFPPSEQDKKTIRYCSQQSQSQKEKNRTAVARFA